MTWHDIFPSSYDHILKWMSYTLLSRCEKLFKSKITSLVPGGIFSSKWQKLLCRLLPFTCQIYSIYCWPDWRVWICQVFQILLSSDKQRNHKRDEKFQWSVIHLFSGENSFGTFLLKPSEPAVYFFFRIVCLFQQGCNFFLSELSFYKFGFFQLLFWWKNLWLEP